MSTNLVRRVVASIAAWTETSTGAAEPDAGERTADAGEHTADRDERTAPSVGLFSCPACSTTYVDEEMAACPECGRAVESVPDGHELGLV